MILLAGLRYWARVLAVAAASGEAAGIRHADLETLRHNLDAIRRHVRDGGAARARLVAAERRDATGGVSGGHAGVAVTRLDETVTALARAAGMLVEPAPAVDDGRPALRRLP
jgi:hypothetical protein